MINVKLCLKKTLFKHMLIFVWVFFRKKTILNKKLNTFDLDLYDYIHLYI